MTRVISGSILLDHAHLDQPLTFQFPQVILSDTDIAVEHSIQQRLPVSMRMASRKPFDIRVIIKFRVIIQSPSDNWSFR